MRPIHHHASHGIASQARDLLAGYTPVPLSLTATYPSANRCDTKFLLSHGRLLTALEFLRDHYSVLEIDGIRVHRYRTLYFDTDAFDLYLSHHGGVRNRYKVRSRLYVDSNRSFFEVKRKLSENRSIKARTETSAMMTELTAEASGFVESHAPAGVAGLEPALWNSFDRITLVSKASAERVTLDLGVRFHNANDSFELPGLAVAELKQDGVDRASVFYRHMRSIGSRSTGFSKYCVGASMLYPQLKRNRIRLKLREIQKLALGECNAA